MNSSIDSINGFGRCLTMCSAAECHFRNAEGLVHPLEADLVGHLPNGGRRKHFRGVEGRMVKSYQRSAAGKSVSDPSELRPFPVLHKTLNYLLKEIPPRFPSDSDWNLVYEFLNDRLRALRQDLIVQRLHSSSVITLMEEMLPFYLVAQNRCERTKCSSYDAKLHRTQLEECLSRLMYAYRDADDSVSSTSKRQMFERIYLLYYLDDYSVASDWLRNNSGCEEKLNQLAKDILSAFVNLNAVRFFRAVRRLNANNCRLECLAVSRHFGALRQRFLQTGLKAYRNQNDSMPIQQSSELLLLNEDLSSLANNSSTIFENLSAQNLSIQLDLLSLHS